MKHGIYVLLLSIILSGCTLFDGGRNNHPDGGVFRSVDSGETWEQKVLIPSTTDLRPTIARVNVVSLEPDPQDHYALYIGTRSQGMFYTYTAANQWFKAPIAAQSRVSAIAVDPQSKCIIYVASGNQVFKSTDCSRSWHNIYVQDNPEETITALDIEPFNTAIIYAGDVRGNIYKSFNFGNSWNAIARLGNAIAAIIIDKDDSNIIYAATRNAGIWKSYNAGESWDNLGDALSEFNGAKTYRQLIVNPKKKNGLFYASSYGILKTDDGGSTWEALPLLTPPRGAAIFALAVNPLNDNEIYYTTKRTLYKTIDGGKHWITKLLPTSRIPTHIYIDPEDPHTIYMAVAAPK